MKKNNIHIGDHVLIGKLEGKLFTYHSEGVCMGFKKGLVKVDVKSRGIEWYHSENVELK